MGKHTGPQHQPTLGSVIAISVLCIALVALTCILAGVFG